MINNTTYIATATTSDHHPDQICPHLFTHPYNQVLT